MSVLFQALQQATRRQNNTAPRRIIPLMTLPRTDGKINWKAIAILSLTLGGLSMGVLALNWNHVITPVFASVQEPQQSQTPTTQQKAEEATPRKTIQAHARIVEAADEPQGIALSIDALTEETSKSADQVSQDIKDLAARLPDLPMLSGSQSKHLVVRDERSKPATPHEAINRANAALKAADFRTARTMAEQALSLEKNNESARDIQLFALSHLPATEALAALKKIEKESEETPLMMGKIQAAIAKITTRTGNLKEAKAHLWKAIEADPENDSYRLSLAILLDRTGEESAALQIYHQIKTPLDPDVQKRVSYLEAQEEDEEQPEKVSQIDAKHATNAQF